MGTVGFARRSRVFDTIPFLATTALLHAFVTGCGLLPQSVSFHRLDISRCEDLSLKWGLSMAGRLSRRTSRKDLECVLAIARREWLQTAELAKAAQKSAFFLADSASDRKEARALSWEAVRWGRLALRMGMERDQEIHYFLAMSLGLAVQDDVVQAMKKLPDIEKHLIAAAVLDPSLDGGGPVRVLGLLYVRAPQWPNGPGDADKGLALLRWAVRKAPWHPLNHLFLAQGLWLADEDAEEARREALTTLRLLGRRDWGYAQAKWKRQVEALLAEIQEEE